MRLFGRAVVVVVFLAVVLVGLVKAYHWSRIRECEEPLHELLYKKARRDDVLAKLGGPFEVAKPAKAEEYAGRWAGLGRRLADRIRESPETLVYLDGEFVFFVHLGGDGRVISFTCVGN